MTSPSSSPLSCRRCCFKKTRFISPSLSLFLSAMALTIVDLQVPYDTHSYFDVTYHSDDIRTLLTYDLPIVDDWIAETLRIHHPTLPPHIVGLDIEWRPNFSRSHQNPVATLQLCLGRRCLIFQLIFAPHMPQSLIDFLANDSFTFVGVGIDEDAEKLYEDYILKVTKTVDLRTLAEEKTGKDLRNAGLKKLAQEILGREIQKPKRVTMSRWDNPWLTLSQVQYACIDAFLSFEIGTRLLST